jgi:hypothetical protein
VTTPPNHLDLLSIARHVRRAAVSEDAATLHAELIRLRDALVQHVQAEQDDVDALPGTTAVVAHHGQRRLLRLLNDVLVGLSDDAASCNCLVRTAQIEAALLRQARLEARLLRRHLATTPPSGRRTRGGEPSTISHG